MARDEQATRDRTWRLIAAVALAIPVVAAVILTSVLSQADVEREIVSPPILAARVLPALLLCVPSLIAAIAVVRRSPAMVVIAGVISLLQSLIAFSGVTLGFLLPAFLLIYLGVQAGDGGTPPGRALLGGILVLALAVSAWLVVLGATETVCWAGGCDNGVPTPVGMAAAAGLAFVAAAVAWRTSGVRAYRT
jgi:hypothetical protein